MENKIYIVLTEHVFSSPTLRAALFSRAGALWCEVVLTPSQLTTLQQERVPYSER